MIDYKNYLHPRFWPTWLGIGLIRLSGLLPWRLQQWLGELLGRISFYLSRERRRIARINLELCFPELSPVERQRLLKQNFIASAKGLLELGTFWWMKGETYRQRSTIYGQEILDQALAEGNVLLLGVHFTCLESSVRALKERGYAPQGMYKPAKNPLFEAFMRAQRNKHYDDAMVPNSEMKRFVRRLKQGKLSWYAPDQSFKKGITYAPLFGLKTASLTATGKIARLGQAKVLPFFGIRNAAGTGYDVHVLPPLSDFPTGDEYLDACKVNAAIEEMIRYAPEQYMWAHRRFKKLADGVRNPYKAR